jgi:hypothetical protein
MDAEMLKAEMNNDVEKVKQFKKRLERTKVRRCAPQSTPLDSLSPGSALGLRHMGRGGCRQPTSSC